MVNQTYEECIAQQFCDHLLDDYKEKYPSYTRRLDPILFHIAVYQSLVGNCSVPGSDGRSLQLTLIKSFERKYPRIEQAQAINWINLQIEVLDAVQGETGDYSYGYSSSGDYVRDYDPHLSYESSINHQLFQALPIANALVEESNHNKEIIKQITDILTKFYPSPLNAAIPGEQALCDLIVSDISNLMVGVSDDKCKAHQLDVYLYLFQSAVLNGNKSKVECAQFASSIQALVNGLQAEGSAPSPISPFWEMGLNYPNSLVQDYNKLVSLLDGQQCTISRKEIADGFELSVWRYPTKEKTIQIVILYGDGCYHLSGADPLHFDDATLLAEHLMNELIIVN